MIEFSIHKIQESPVFGFGYGSIVPLLRENGFNNASTHNSIVDFMLNYGLILTIVYLLIILKSFIIGLKMKSDVYVNLMLVFLFFNMNTILYSFGGVGFPSIMFTVFMGLTYYGGYCEKYKIKYNNSGI